MSIIEYLRKIVRTAELDAKIKSPGGPTDKPSIPSNTGVATQLPNTPQTTCPSYYTARANSYDIGDILSGAAGPTVGDQCSIITTITGLTDVDTSKAVTSLGGTVLLTIQLDGIIK